MTPDRIPNLEHKVDELVKTLHTMHTEIVREIRDTIEDALDRHIAHCPNLLRIEGLERHSQLECPLTPRVEALEAKRESKSIWDKLGPWAIIVAGFALGALLASGVVSAEVLAAILPF